MGKTAKHSKALTPPKGRATPTRDREPSAWADRWVTLQWAALGLLVVAVVVVAIYIGADQEPRPLHGGR
jgi:hypothetical protein